MVYKMFNSSWKVWNLHLFHDCWIQAWRLLWRSILIEAAKQYFQSRIMEMLMLYLLKPIQKQKVLSLRLSWILLGKKAHQSLLRLKIDNDWRCSCEISTNGTNHFMSTVKHMLMESHSWTKLECIPLLKIGIDPKMLKDLSNLRSCGKLCFWIQSWTANSFQIPSSLKSILDMMALLLILLKDGYAKMSLDCKLDWTLDRNKSAKMAPFCKWYNVKHTHFVQYFSVYNFTNFFLLKLF